MRHYCKDHEPKKPTALAGGTWCVYHKQELCRVIEPHCRICGVKLK